MEFLKKYTSHEEYEVDKTPNVSLCVENNEKHLHYTKKKFDDEYLTFEALESGTFTMVIGTGITTGDVVSVSYSLDNGETWTTTNNGNNKYEPLVITVNVSEGDEVLWKGNANRMTKNSALMDTSLFSSTANFNARGNVMSLLYGDEFKGKVNLRGKGYCFSNLFYVNTKLINAKNISLPATTLASNCYASMFNGCTSLTTAPELPATTLTSYCYENMFRDCTSLTVAPELPATTLATECYYGMLQGCTSLTTAPELPATTLTSYCYQSMFRDCTNLTVAPELPATTLAIGCYDGMFDDCTSLTVAPELPATTLANSCYASMFYGCTSLTVAPELPATTLAINCYYFMFNRCTSLTTAPELPATTLANSCYESMFSFCKNLTTAPELPATTLATECYRAMFSSCASLATAPELPATALEDHCYAYMFSGCKSITTAPELSATTLANYCYSLMFSGCESITTAPVLPATILADYCYQDMFHNCTSLITAPELPVTTLAEYCYAGMFEHCENLTTAPELPATTLAVGCYQNMFSNCTSLTTAPVLPATTLATECYRAMFSSCASLATAPELPATTLAQYCYAYMFYGCTRLTTAPELPATTLAGSCYSYMFSGCTNLNSITCLATNISANNYTYNWVSGVANSGTFIKDPSMTGWSRGNNGIPTNWTVQDYDYSKDYLTFDILSAGTINWKASTAATLITISYSLNGGEWTDITSSTAGTSFNVSKGDSVRFKGNNSTYGTYANYRTHYNTFSGSTAYFNIKGNIMSLISGDSFTNAITLNDDYTFTRLFTNTYTVNTQNLTLPATTLTKECYEYMFGYCSFLRTAPELPAITLSYKCYLGMFDDCTSLATAPELSATTLANYCYDNMFRHCISLTTAPELPATTLASNCYNYMFGGCTSLTVAPELSATTLAESCYQHMFEGCTSLTEAPELPATTLANYCYSNMFEGCTSLITGPTSIGNNDTRMVSSACTYMFYGCTSLTTAPELPATTLANYCYRQMFYGCTSLTVAPKLPAARLTVCCYDDMFYGCTRLNSITCLATDISANYCTRDWVSGVANSGTFIKNKTMTGWTTGVNGIPTNWTVKDYYGDEYLTFDILSSGTIVWKTSTTAATVTTISYSINNGAWTDITSTKAGTSFNVSDGDKVRFKGNNAGYSTTLRDFNTFSGSTASFNLEGNIMSLIDDTIFDHKTTLDTDLTFNSLFRNTNVNNTENLILPATTLTSSCYYSMFYNCASITTTPELPATTLANNCYSSMFEGCTSLTTAPELPVTTLANGCYGSMFRGCTNLTTASELPATSLTYQCYIHMFEGCASLTTAPELPATTLANECYVGMFRGCTSLTTAPELPATTLANSCYWYMFSNCTSLTTASELPATSLTYQCYYGMFSGCTSLNSITCLATNISANNCTQNWVNGVASSGVFTKAPSMSSWTTGVNGIPTNWTVRDYSAISTSLVMYVDDFPEERLVGDYGETVEEVMQFQLGTSNECLIGNKYVYTGETITYNGNTYYLWEMSDDCSWDSRVVYLLTTTDNFNTLYAQSLEDDLTNHFTSLVGRLDEDKEVMYSADEIGSEYELYLVKVIDNNPALLRIWVDDFPEDARYEEGSAQDKMTAEVEDPEVEGANPYEYFGETIVYNGNIYYLWQAVEGYNVDNSNSKYFATTTIDFNTLYSQSLEDDLTNHFTDAIGMFTDSKSIYLEQGELPDGSDAHYLVKVEDLS